MLWYKLLRDVENLAQPVTWMQDISDERHLRDCQIKTRYHSCKSFTRQTVCNQEDRQGQNVQLVDDLATYFDLAPVQFRDALPCTICETHLICQPNVMVVGMISLSNMPLTVRKGDWL